MPTTSFASLRAKQCVDWAIGMLEEGHSGVYLQILASLAEPLDLRSMNGAYLDPTVEGQAQHQIQSTETELKDAIEGKLYGFATVPGARSVPIYTHTNGYDEEAAGDGFYADFPMSSL